MKARVAKTQVTVYCLCGASLTSWGPPGVATATRLAWLAEHAAMEGHGPATREQAQTARRRAQ